MEGTRPVLVEVQALVAPSALGTPRPCSCGVGFSQTFYGSRGSGIPLWRQALQHDVYLNIAGGYRISEPAGDMAVAAAPLVSSLSGIPLPKDSVYFGEISLSGAVRPVAQTAQRVKEAEKLGFSKASYPVQNDEKTTMATFSPQKPTKFGCAHCRLFTKGYR